MEDLSVRGGDGVNVLTLEVRGDGGGRVGFKEPNRAGFMFL